MTASLLFGPRGLLETDYTCGTLPKQCHLATQRIPGKQILMCPREAWEDPRCAGIRSLEVPVRVSGPHSVPISWWPRAIVAHRWVLEKRERFDVMHLSPRVCVT